jgi:hypothetical protein
MGKNTILFIMISLIVFLYFSNMVGLGIYESASIGLLIFSLFNFLDNIGKKVVVLDIAIVVAIFTWLVMPVIFYQFYTREDTLARIFYKYMPIPADRYFPFVFPGTLSMIAGFKIPLARLQMNTNPRLYREKLEIYFNGKDRIGFILIGIGFASSILHYFIPPSLNHIIDLMTYLPYVGVFYIFFSQHKRKKLILGIVLAVLVSDAVIKGIFGVMVFLLILFYILIALYLKKIPFYTKLLITIFGILVIFLIQSVKKQYREEAWQKGGDATYFFKLMGASVSNPEVMFQEKALFGISVRMNQGWLIAVTMDRVPRIYEYANGETILTSVLAAFIPRVVWPDKPEAGGKYNLKRFWGYTLVGYSMNIGPIGEAYANFGTTGGIIFMFFYGLFFNAMLTLLLKWSEKRPSILCWIPFLFFYAVVVETDILTTVGSIVTSMIFMIIFIRIFKLALNIKL